MKAFAFIFMALIFLFPLFTVQAAVDNKNTSQPFLWHDGNGSLNDKGTVLIEILQVSAEHGLNPENYNANQTLFTDEGLTAARAYIRDLSTGRKAHQETNPKLYIYTRNIDTHALLAAVYDSHDLASTFEDLAPNYPEYRLLKKKLRLFRKIEKKGNWPQVPDTKTLSLGDQDSAVEYLKARLSNSNHVESLLLAQRQ